MDIATGKLCEIATTGRIPGKAIRRIPNINQNPGSGAREDPNIYFINQEGVTV